MEKRQVTLLMGKIKTKSLTFNAVMSVLLTASNMIVGFIAVPYVTRVLSVEGYGDVSFAQNVAMWLQSLCMFGVGTYGIRECAKVRDDEIALATVVKELLIVVSIASAVVLTCFGACIVFIPRLQSLAPLMWMFLFSTLIMSYGVEWFFQAVEQYRYITVRSVFFKVVSLIATVLLVKKPEDYLVYGGIVAFVQCGNNFFNLAKLVKLVNFKEVHTVNPGRHLAPLLSFALLAIASSAYMSLDSVILGMSSSTNYQLGLYQLVGKLKNIAFQVLNSILFVFIPRLSNYMSTGRKDDYYSLLKTGLQFTLMITSAVVVLFNILPAEIVTVLGSRKYMAAVPSLRVISLVNMLSCLGYFMSYCILIPCGKERNLTVANIAGLCVSLVLNVSLDGCLGALGAAVSMLFAELVIVVSSGLGAWVQLSRVACRSDLLKLMLANCLAAACAILAKGMVASAGTLFITVFITIVYAVILICCLCLFRFGLVYQFINRMVARWKDR